MGHAHVVYTHLINASIEAVFECLTDHAGMHDWPGISSAELIVEGEPTNGVGAVREIRARGLKLNEKIVHYESPHRYDYQIVKGLPVEHIGSVRLSQEGAQVLVHWEVRMKSRVPLLAQVVGKMLKDGLPDALDHVKRKVEATSA